MANLPSLSWKVVVFVDGIMALEKISFLLRIRPVHANVVKLLKSLWLEVYVGNQYF